MKANELRIGNLFKDREDRLCSVELITDEFDECDILAIDGAITAIPVEPIPLTEEWLLKFGFEIDEIWDDGEVSESNYKLKVNCDEELYINIGLGIWQLGSDVHMCYTRNRDIQYVHQLQNLYFALTGDELSL